MNTSGIIKLLLLLPALSCCSVKENRNDCSAWLSICSDGNIADSFSGNLLFNISGRRNKLIDRSQRNFEQFIHSNAVFEVPRHEQIRTVAFGGIDKMQLGENALTIVAGNACDSLYKLQGSVIVDGDEYMMKTSINKEFATCTINFLSKDDKTYIRLKGNIDGYGLYDGEPHRGLFLVRPVFDGNDSFSCRIPRQTDESLELELCRSEDDSLIHSFHIGKTIMAMNYDWKDKNLKDIKLSIDFTASKILVTIEEWTVAMNVKLNL